MGSKGYYALAVVLLLATVPLYRYIYERSTQIDVPSEPASRVSSRQQSVIAQQKNNQAVERLFQALDASQRQRLQPNQRCYGGVVIEVRGTTYTQLSARCTGDYVEMTR